MRIPIPQIAAAIAIGVALTACNRNDAETDMPAEGGMILDSPAMVNPGTDPLGDTMLRDTLRDSLLNIPM